MSILQTDELIQGLQNIKAFSPFLMDGAVIEEYIKSARQDALSLDRHDAPTTQLISLVEPPLIFLKKGVKDRLFNKTEIYCLPYPLSLAYCDQIDDRNIIVVGQGLIDLISYTIHRSHFESTIPLNFATYHSLRYRRDMPFTELASNCLFLFALRFYRYAESMPDLYSFLSDKQKEDSKIAISGALLFVLLHELGHLELGHLENCITRPNITAKLISEELDSTRQLELEADGFAIRSFIDPAQELGQYWCSMAMSFFSELELISGSQHETHPLALNRRFVSANSVNTDEHFSELAKRYNNTKHLAPNFQEKIYGTTRKGGVSVLQEIALVLSAEGIKIDEMIK